jgi:hypothetical protein
MYANTTGLVRSIELIDMASGLLEMSSPEGVKKYLREGAAVVSRIG